MSTVTGKLLHSFTYFVANRPNFKYAIRDAQFSVLDQKDVLGKF